MIDVGNITSLLESKTTMIFDFDGVIVDSVEVKTDSFAELYREYGEDVVQKVVAYHRQHGGFSRVDKLRHYHRVFLGKEPEEEEIEVLADRFACLVVEKVVACPEVPGARAFVEQCVEADKACFVNSATPQEEVRGIVERRGLSPLFQGVFGSPRSKLENLQLIFERTNSGPDDTLFFGDASADFEAARAVGAIFIGVGDGIRPLLEGADTRCFHIDDFLNLI